MWCFKTDDARDKWDTLKEKSVLEDAALRKYVASYLLKFGMVDERLYLIKLIKTINHKCEWGFCQELEMSEAMRQLLQWEIFINLRSI